MTHEISNFIFFHKYEEKFFDFQEADRNQQADAYADFLRNFVDFTQSCYKVPKCSAVSIGKCLFAKMTDASLHFNTPVRTLAILSWAKTHGLNLLSGEILAIWFHDSIHKINAAHGVNEFNGARFMTALMSQWLDPSQLTRVQSAIEDTRKCLDLEPSQNTRVIDLTLSSFTWPDDSRKTANKALIKQLSRLYCKDKICKLRKSILEKLLKRDPFFNTPLFTRTFHKIAIDNVKKDLEDLNGIVVGRSERETQVSS